MNRDVHFNFLNFSRANASDWGRFKEKKENSAKSQQFVKNGFKPSIRFNQKQKATWRLWMKV